MCNQPHMQSEKRDLRKLDWCSEAVFRFHVFRLVILMIRRHPTSSDAATHARAHLCPVKRTATDL